MTQSNAHPGEAAIVSDMQRLRQHHEFTRDRIGQPGCPVRRTAAEYVEIIDRALASLSTNGAPRWASSADPVGALAIKLASRANDCEEECGEWTWRDIAIAALEKPLPADALDGGTIEACAKVAENFPHFINLPDVIIPAHDETDDYGEFLFRVDERVQKMKRTIRGSDIAAVIRALAAPQDAAQGEGGDG